MVEDADDICMYQFNLSTQKLVNNEKPIFRLSKQNIDHRSSIVDFWVYSREVKANSKTFFHAGLSTFDVAFYFLTKPCNKFYVFYLNHKVPSLELISEEVRHI